MGRRCYIGTDTLAITVGCRTSPLSKAQVEEIYREIKLHHSSLIFNPVYIECTGDKDRKTSLRMLDKTNFFTKEIDGLLLQGGIRIGVHAAKDLPEPLPEGLQLIAMTKGLDPRDALVFKKRGETLETLPSGARIGTSSTRREEMLMKRRQDLQFVDIRGTIEMRLRLLEENIVDAVVIAECALIRLKLHNLPRCIFEDETAPHQGRLAVVAREDDLEIKYLFSPIHHEKNSLSRT